MRRDDKAARSNIDSQLRASFVNAQLGDYANELQWEVSESRDQDIHDPFTVDDAATSRA
jgi:hypothetical protein